MHAPHSHLGILCLSDCQASYSPHGTSSERVLFGCWTEVHAVMPWHYTCDTIIMLDLINLYRQYLHDILVVLYVYHHKCNDCVTLEYVTKATRILHVTILFAAGNSNHVQLKLAFIIINACALDTYYTNT